MDIIQTQMMFANCVRINAKHALKLLPSAQVVSQIGFYNLIYATAYLAFMIHLADVKDALINVQLVKLLQLNAYHVIQYLIEHYSPNSAAAIKATLILEHLFAYSVPRLV